VCWSKGIERRQGAGQSAGGSGCDKIGRVTRQSCHPPCSNRLLAFPNQQILEDVAFCETLIKTTIPLLLSPPVITDARMFLIIGVWRSRLRVLLIILHVEFRLPVLPGAFFQDVR
jgi:hypothetical protein